MVQLQGMVEQVETLPARAQAIADAAVSDTVIYCADVRPLLTLSGSCTIDIAGVQYTATTSDVTDAVTVTPALSVAVEDGDWLVLVPAASFKKAWVSLSGDDDGELLECRVAASLVAKSQFRDGPKNDSDPNNPRTAVIIETEPEPLITEFANGPWSHDATTEPIVVMSDSGESVTIDGDGITAFTDDQQVVWVAPLAFDASVSSSVASAADDPEDLLDGVVYGLRANDLIYRYDLATGVSSTAGGAFPLSVAGVGCVAIAATTDWLYIIDSSADIRRYSTTTGTQDGNPWKAGTFSLIAADASSVYAIDSANDIRKYDATTGTESGSPWKAGTFARIATDGSGNLTAYDSATPAFRKYDAAGIEDTTGDWPLAVGSNLNIAATGEWFYAGGTGIDQYAMDDAALGGFISPDVDVASIAAHAGYVLIVSVGKALTCYSTPGTSTVSWRLSAADGQVYAPPFANIPVIYSTRWSRATNQAVGTSGTASTVTYPVGGAGSSPAGPYWSQSSGVVTVNEDGVYDVTSFVEWEANATGDRRVRINVNGTIFSGDAKSAASDVTRHNMTTTLILAAGDQVNVQATQFSGGSLNITAAHLTITRRGALAA